VAWGIERVSLLKKLWSDGLSAGQIAQRLGGVTRNAVISKIHRLGLPGRSKRNRVARRAAPGAFGIQAKTRKSSRAIPVEIVRSVEAVPPPRADDIPTKTFDELQLDDGLCRHRVDRPFKGRPYGFCGKPTLVGLTCCKQHAPRWFANWAEIAPLYRERTKTKVKQEVVA
jgi:GcrA cell cycle regulator